MTTTERTPGRPPYEPECGPPHAGISQAAVAARGNRLRRVLGPRA